MNDMESLIKMEKNLEGKVNGPISFNSLKDKIEISQSQTLKRTKRMKVGRIGNKLVVAAEWVDEEVQFYIKERKYKNKDWRQARNKKAPMDTQNILKARYIEQQIKTSRLIGMKKGN